MPSSIQNYPPGLLTLLGLKGGENPTSLSDVVVPIVDVTPRYNAGLVTTKSSGSSVVNTLGASLTLTVPAGECWDVIAVGFTGALLAAALEPALEININGCAVAYTQNVGDVTRANPFEHGIAFTPGSDPLILLPGMTIQGLIRSTPNSNITAILRALVRVAVV